MAFGRPISQWIVEEGGRWFFGSSCLVGELLKQKHLAWYLNGMSRKAITHLLLLVHKNNI